MVIQRCLWEMPGKFPILTDIVVTQMVVQEHDIRTVSYCAQDCEDLRTFAYINRDHVTGNHYCHVFQAQTMVRTAITSVNTSRNYFSLSDV